jgi:DNA-binding NtrC family response regulator/tetratricopeptide (TPR) repeat protein
LLLEQLNDSRLNAFDASLRDELMASLEWSSSGNVGAALFLAQRAFTEAKRSNNLDRICRSQLQLIKIVSESSGYQAVLPILLDLRSNAIALGDSVVSAAVHIFAGQIDSQRGFTITGLRHTSLGLRLLDIEDNVWLRACGENVRIASFIIESDYESAIVLARETLQRIELTGNAFMCQSLLANLGLSYYRIGDFDESLRHLTSAMEAFPCLGARRHGLLESFGCVYKSMGRISEARECFDKIHSDVKHESDWLLYLHRHARLRECELFLLEHSFDKAEKAIDHVLQLAERSGDQLLRYSALLVKANVLCVTGRDGDCRNVIRQVTGTLPYEFPELAAHYERVMAIAAALAGKREASQFHYDRSRRLCESLKDVPGAIELDRGWNEATVGREAVSSPHGSARQLATNVLQNVAGLLQSVNRPELLANALVTVLSDTAGISRASVVCRLSGSTELLTTFANPDSRGDESFTSVEIPVDEAGGRWVGVLLEAPKDDLESIATLNAVTLLMQTVRELQRARAEREEQMALWPIEDVPDDAQNTIIGGRMRDLMGTARKVAMTNVSVLLTGESGTGKEILARAIHGYSPRAHKPFIPFNCTAVPPDMLESQLFGHRRGAFTSADRDNPGLIRSARDGTLFLDEIGELSLELQPKLLRFLEAGEICPLGEAMPLQVDVRVIAATNRDLDALVRDGRFREDLFYRLNVVRLTIPPLRERCDEIPALVHHFAARAATEFNKGRIRVADETMEHLLLHTWPGNVRQLQNEVRRMIAFADADAVLKPSALSEDIKRAAVRQSQRSAGQIAVALDEKLAPTLSKIEREMIRTALRAHHGRLEDAARALGISRKGLYLKRQRLGL